MEDFELKIAIKDPNKEDSFKIDNFKCYTENLSSAVALASNELGFMRVVEIIDNEE